MMKDALHLNEDEIKQAIEEYVEKKTGKESEGVILSYHYTADLRTNFFATVITFTAKDKDGDE